MSDKTEIIGKAGALVREFMSISRNRDVSSRMPRIGSAIFRALAYQLRYLGANSINSEVCETISATALIDRRIFEVAQRQGIEPIKLLNQVSSKVKQAISEALKLGSEGALYMLENCIILFELEKIRLGKSPLNMGLAEILESDADSK